LTVERQQRLRKLSDWFKKQIVIDSFIPLYYTQRDVVKLIEHEAMKRWGASQSTNRDYAWLTYCRFETIINSRLEENDRKRYQQRLRTGL